MLGASVGGPWPFNDRGFAVARVYLETTRGSDDAAAAATAVASHAATSSGGAVGPKSKWSGGRRRLAAAASGEARITCRGSLVRLRGGRGRGGGGAWCLVPRRRAAAARSGVQSWGEEGGEGRDAVYASLRTQALDVRRRGILHQRARGGAAVHRRRARGDPQGDLPRVHGSLGFCCVGTNPGGDGRVTAAATTVRAHGALGPVYVFNEPIGVRRVSQLNARGGTYVPRMRAPPTDPPRSISESDGGAGGKKIAGGFQLANAAAKAVVKVASDGVKKIDQRGEGTRFDVGKDGDGDGDGTSGEESEVAEGVWNFGAARGER